MNSIKESNNLTSQTATQIEFTQATVRFGNTIYQLKNLTGLTVGKIPPNEILAKTALSLCIVGALLLFVGATASIYPASMFGLTFIVLAALFKLIYDGQDNKYGLILNFNSGHSDFFESRDKSFLFDIVQAIQKLMDENAQRVEVNMINKSVNVIGDFNGNLHNGEKKVAIFN